MNTPAIELRLDTPVAQLTLNRPSVKNALDQSAWTQLCSALDTIRRTPAIRVLIVRGAGGNFCSGADIREFLELADDPARLKASNALIQDAQERLEELPIPTVAAIEGICIGGGCGIALACDFRLASEDASFAITPARLGLIYSYRDTRRLVAAVGSPFAKEMLFTARRLDAAEALRRGLVGEVIPRDKLSNRTTELASVLASGSGQSLRGIKQVIATIDGHGALDHESIRTMFNDAFLGDDLREGVAAFREKRPPRFA